MLNVPFTYENLNRLYGTMPQSFVHIHNTGISKFFKRYLLQDALSVYQWTLPDNWDADYFRYIIMGFGHCAVFKTDLFGIIPQHATLYGYNVFYRPTTAIVANPLIKSREMTIDKDCAIIKLMPDYGSVTDLIDYYGDLMALTYESLSINILNTRLAYLIGVNSKAEADTYKEIFDSIATGKPAVVYRSEKGKAAAATSNLIRGDSWQTLIQNLNNSYIADRLLESLNAIRDEFLTHIGIPNLSERKKERVNLIDSKRNDTETRAKCSLWLEELEKSIDSVIELFPELKGQLSVKLRFPATEGDEQMNVSETVGNWSV